MPRRFASILVFGGLLWVTALVLAPVFLAAESVVAAVLYEACGLICHQRPERSFHLAGIALPVCARCLGLYVSGAAGAFVANITSSREPVLPHVGPDVARRVLVAAALPTALTLMVEWGTLAQPGSLGRAVAAIPLGCAIGWLLVRTIRSELNVAGPAERMRYHA